MTDLCEYWDKGILIKAKLGKIFQTEETVISEGCYDQIVDLTYKNSLEIKKNFNYNRYNQKPGTWGGSNSNINFSIKLSKDSNHYLSY